MTAIRIIFFKQFFHIETKQVRSDSVQNTDNSDLKPSVSVYFYFEFW